VRLVYDVARRTIRQSGLTRFIAVCLLSGYIWLGAGGGLALVNGGVMAGPHYDALLHAIFLGFVFAMIFGHAPIIFPSVLKIPITFQLAFYAPLILLHLSLLLRVVGDLTLWMPGRQWGGMVNVLTLLAFMGGMVRSRSPQQTPAGAVHPQPERLLRGDIQEEEEMSSQAKAVIYLFGAISGLLAGVLIVSGAFVGLLGSRLAPADLSAPVQRVAAAPPAAPVDSQAVSGGALEGKVQIANQAFSPHTIIVATGAQITWKNEDTVNHTITSAEGWFDSKEIAPGDTFSWKADKAGTFKYHCELHPEMEGVIVVQPGGAVASTLFGGGPVKQYFADTCGGCHGPNREGGTGPALIPERLTSDDDFYFNNDQKWPSRHNHAVMGNSRCERRRNLDIAWLYPQRTEC